MKYVKTNRKHIAPHILCFPTFDLCEISSRENFINDLYLVLVAVVVVQAWHLDYSTIIATRTVVVRVQKSIENGICGPTLVYVSFAIQLNPVVFLTVSRACNYKFVKYEDNRKVGAKQQGMKAKNEDVNDTQENTKTKPELN